MFRKMRRSHQELSHSETEAILKSETHGVLALSGDEGYPYALPISYAYADGVLYFHCAKQGHKLDAIAQCSKASFCVVAMDEIVPEEYTTLYKSAIAFGKLSIITEPTEARRAIELIGRKYNPQASEAALAETIESYTPALCLLKLDIEHLSGKLSKELMSRQKET